MGDREWGRGRDRGNQAAVNEWKCNYGLDSSNDEMQQL